MTGDITRREFIKTAGAVAAGMALNGFGVLPSEAAEGDHRPNIVFMIADDWSYPHASVYGDKIVKTPNFDKVANEGVLFTNSFCAAPTCTASRGGVCTGQAIHRLDEGANLYGSLPGRFKTYPDILEAQGYTVGMSGKGWAPGPLENAGRTRNPAGPEFKNFKEFMAQAPKDKPFCFWFGSHFPHRDYEPGCGAKSGMKPEDVEVPPFLPDTPEIRNDILDYYWEVQQFDAQVGAVLGNLELSGRAENTIVVITSDNGMPFPRSKANLYDVGTHMPLAIRWPAKVRGGRKVDDPVGHTDFAPTFLDAAGIKPPSDMTGTSLLDLLQGDGNRDAVFTERERHVNCRKGDLSYPARAVRTKDFLYIRNFRPDLWPAGDPEMWVAVGPFGDIDTSPSKKLLLNRRDDSEIKPFFDLATAKRPAEELFDLKKDPWNLHNVADDPDYAGTTKKLAKKLKAWMAKTDDPRAKNPDDDRWDKYHYFGVLGEWVFPKPPKT
jgi:arylsulfatase A-like enzyme